MDEVAPGVIKGGRLLQAGHADVPEAVIVEAGAEHGFPLSAGDELIILVVGPEPRARGRGIGVFQLHRPARRDAARET